MDTPIHKHVFNFSPRENGGEALTLTTLYFDNGDKDINTSIYCNQKLTLNSYCNSATFDLCGITISSTRLRQLADQLDRAMEHAQQSKVKSTVVENVQD